MSGFTLITGASEGIGRAFAELAAARGCNLVLSARSADRLNELATSLRGAHGVEVVTIPADLADLGDAERLWTEATQGRRIERLINNAGLGANGDFAADWDRELQSIDVNIRALTLLMARAVAHMRGHDHPQGARILNVASVAAFMPGPSMAVYHATKAFVLSLSEAVSEELRGSGITVTALCPGPTQSRFFERADMQGARVTKLGRIPTAAEVAQAGWDGAERGRAVVVPGLLNKINAFLPRLAPRWIPPRVAGPLMRARR